MLLSGASKCGSQTRGDVRCSAKGQGRRGSQHGGSSNSSSRGRSASPPSRKNSASVHTDSVSRMSAAAKAAAKRAAMFSKQRMERAITTLDPAVIEPTSSSSSSSSLLRGSSSSSNWRSQFRSITPATFDNQSDGDSQQLQLRPYVETVVEHLKQQSSTAASSSSGSSGRGRGAKRAVARSLIESHSLVFQAALDLELQEEWKEAEERLQSWPVARLQSEGVALFGLAAAADGGLFRDVVIKFFLPNRPLPFHALSQGDILLVSRGDPLSDSHEAVVVDYSSRWIRLALNQTAAAAVAAAGRAAAWRLDLFANTVSHERCSEALRRFAAAAGSSGSSSSGGLLSSQVVQQQDVIWRVLAGVIPAGQSVSSLAAQLPPWLKTAAGRDRLAAARSHIKTLTQRNKLNPSQARAVAAALSSGVTLWQGPPGTGKTTTLLRLCECALQVLSSSGSRVLAVAASNVAVDNLVTGLLQLGIRVVRIGQPAKISAEIRSVSLEVLAAATVPGMQAAKMRQRLVAAAAAAPRGSSSKRRGSSSSSSSSNVSGMWEQMLALEAAAAAEVLGNAQVVAATCVGAGDPVISERDFDIVVIDEATQATEPAALVPAAARCQSLVLVGDPQQLPPTVKCQQAEQQLGLNISLFSRLQAMGLQPLLLDVQYRMHPAICEFPSVKFYQGRLKSWPSPEDRLLPGGVEWPNPEVPVMFIQCNGSESRSNATLSISRIREGDDDRGSSSSGGGSSSSSSSSSGYSFMNRSEAAAVVHCVHQLLLDGGLTAADIGVITPYSAQVRLIRQLLGDTSSSSSSSSSNRPTRRSSTQPSQASLDSVDNAPFTTTTSNSSSTFTTTAVSSSSDVSSTSLSNLEVKSVDGFQGREKEVIIFSAVRSNAGRRVGFLSDYRRLNVALTRAKRGLVVVGDAETLRSDAVWASWLKWAHKQGVVVDNLL